MKASLSWSFSFLSPCPSVEVKAVKAAEMGQRHQEAERRATEIENVVWFTFQEHVQQRTVVELVGGTVS